MDLAESFLDSRAEANSMRVQLKIIGGSRDGKKISIPSGEFVIGRGKGCQLQLRSDAVSRKHCTLIVTESQVILRDFGSKNGSYVNDDRIEDECGLQQGDVVRIGPLSFEVVLELHLGEATRSQVKDVKEAAARTAKGKDGDWDVTQWLEEDSTVEGVSDQSTDPEMREYRLEDTQQLSYGGADETTRDEIPDINKNPDGISKGKPDNQKSSAKFARPTKPKTKDSKEAAEEMLRKFFNKG